MSSIARGDSPCFASRTTLTHDHGPCVQCYRRADVARKRKERLADGNRTGVRRFDHEMFFAMANERCVIDSGNHEAFVESHFGGDRLVAEIETDPILSRFTNHTRQ